MADDKITITADEKAALDRIIDAGLADPKRLEVMVALIDASQAWGWFRKFLIQAAAATGAITAIVTALVLLRDWWNRQ